MPLLMLDGCSHGAILRRRCDSEARDQDGCVLGLLSRRQRQAGATHLRRLPLRKACSSGDASGEASSRSYALLPPCYGSRSVRSSG